MPTRILREGILTSPRVNSLTPHAELFYRRLMSVTDDYGRYFGNETLLRAACYPFQVDRINEASISKHLAECVGARLIVPYTIAGTAYLQLLDTRQQTRSKSKFPEPPSELISTCEAAAKRMESGCESNVLVVEGEVGVVGDIKTVSAKADAVAILDFLNEKTGRKFPALPANLDLVKARLREATAEDIRSVIAIKCRQWAADEKMAKYLRPATLFGRQNFAQYLGELNAVP